ncbi:MAG: NHL repeat-containing protein [Mycobacterium sp.]|uniref:NHL repeat-containing protein n=1 Tax=Mycobacterium sp. TaxID=1785 RepID=UPI00261739F1|nr:NHL repeat-containing protein [Mycobacterium sp.]MDI3314035.1 NHL repeat-containing protein [Mycobacterium sp.]
MSAVGFAEARVTRARCRAIGVARMSGQGFAHPVDVALGNGDTVYVLSRSSAWKDKNPRITVTSLDERAFSEIGGFGTEPGCFLAPTALATDPGGRIYVADEDLHQISVFDPDGTSLRRWGTHGSGSGQLDRPSGLRVDADGCLWVSDSVNARLQRFTADGIPLCCVGSFGAGPGQLNMPWGVAIGPEGDIWVADWRNDRVQRFSPDGELRGIYGDDLLSRPSGVAVDAAGRLYVSDWGHDCVQMFDEQGRHRGTLVGDASLSRWAQQWLEMYPQVNQRRQEANRYEEERRFFRPVGMVIGPEGQLLVADSGRHRIQIYEYPDHTPQSLRPEKV